jgi:retinol dehydrogenase 14
MSELRGKTALITGATSGIGLEASVQLARMGCEVVMVARDRSKGEATVADAKRRSGSNAVALLLCDFSSQAAIRKMTAEFLSSHERLELLINNAGGVVPERRTTIDGIEQTLAVNHLGYFLTTNLLLSILEKSAPARIVNVASAAHRRATLDFDDLQFEKGGYSTLKAYGRSKLANVLFTNELARRLAGKNITANCLHPGVVATHIWSQSRLPLLLRPILALLKRFAMITPEQGAGRIVFLAANSSVEGKSGGYYENDKLVEPAPLARDPAVAQRLWSESAKLVKLNSVSAD